jgi:predicted RNA-binding protein with PUA-like domain
MHYWLIKSEGDCYPIDALKKDKRTAWTEVRNYQARNFMIRDMQIGDLILFYHSSAEPTGVYGLAKVAREAHPDETQFDKKSEYYDPKSTRTKPIWECVDVAFVEKFQKPVSLEEIKKDKALEGMVVRARGSRLSIQPVSPEHFRHIQKLAKH